MSLSSYCRNCGLPNGTTEEMCANHCNNCEEARKTAMQAAKEKDTTLQGDELLYVGRQALMQRAHHPRETFINPRDFSRTPR